MTKLVLRSTDLSKRYRGNVLAVDEVNLSVASGEIYAFLGLNGAGKSTTIRMLLGMITPTHGYVELFGERVRPEAARLWRRVGHLVDTAIAYPARCARTSTWRGVCKLSRTRPSSTARSSSWA
jgi:ABC-2 type transport system ATP-binding protein